MLVERTESPGFLSNAYLVAEGPGGSGVLIDANGVLEPLMERVERDGIRIEHVLLTHGHGDHRDGLEELARRYGVQVKGFAELGDGGEVGAGPLVFRALHTPGHAPDHVAFLVGDDVFTGDVLFKGTVGGCAGPGGSYDALRRSVDRLLELPTATRVHPGHREPTTIGAEAESNPFVRAWRGLDPPGDERVRVGGRDATLLLWAPDYDGGHKAWVRFDDGEELVVGGSRVERV